MTVEKFRFPKGLSLTEFQSKYGSEAQCNRALATARWPEGFSCPQCNARDHSSFERQGRAYWQCASCHRQITVISGTIFQATKLPLTQWFMAMYLLTQSTGGLPALTLMRHLGVSYRTAWTIKHKLLQVMELQERDRVLSGDVETLRVSSPSRSSCKSGARSMILSVQKCGGDRPRLVKLSHQVPGVGAEGLVAAGTSTTANRRSGLPDRRSKNLLTDQENVHSIPELDRRVSNRRRANAFTGHLRSRTLEGRHMYNFGKYGPRYLAAAQYRFNRRGLAQHLVGDLIRDAATTKPAKAFLLRSP